jgi:hypothetical protein
MFLENRWFPEILQAGKSHGLIVSERTPSFTFALILKKSCSHKT